MTDVSGVSGPRGQGPQGAGSVLGKFKDFLVRADRFFSQIGERIREWAGSVKRSFVSLFSLPARQTDRPLPREGVSPQVRLERDIDTLLSVDCQRRHPIQGREDIDTSWIFRRDCGGSATFRLDGERLPTGIGTAMTEQSESDFAKLVASLEDRLGTDCIPLLSGLVNQGTFGCIDSVLGSPGTPVRLENGTEVGIPAARRSYSIDIDGEEDGTVVLSFHVALTEIPFVSTFDPESGLPSIDDQNRIQVGGDSRVEADLQIRLVRNHSGIYEPRIGDLQVRSDLR